MRRALVLVAISLGVAFANWNDTSTGIDLNNLPHFPLTKIRSGWLKKGSRATFEGISATAANSDEQEVRLRGVGKSGKPWEARIFGLDEVWRADLDNNGTQDFVLFGAGPYFNGRTTPLFSLSILLMDREKMPVPFFTVVYKGENGDGIRHLVDLNHDGHAELLISDYDELPSDPLVGPFCSGHWVSQLYRFRNLGAEEIRGTIGGIRFPFIHNWTYRGTECRAEPKPISDLEPAVVSNYGSTVQAQAVTRITRAEDADGRIAIEPAAGCQAITAGIVVYDSASMRQIAFPNFFGSYAKDLADRIRRDGGRVELRGIDKPKGDEACSVSLLWAK